MNLNRCKATKADGNRCGHVRGLNPETGLCLFHDPTRREERRAFQSRRRRAKKPTKITTIEDVVAARAWLFQELMAKRLERDEAGTMRAVLADQEKSIASTLLRRVRALEDEIKRLGKA